MAKRVQGKAGVKAGPTKAGTCRCGGDLVMARVVPQVGKARMAKVCVEGGPCCERATAKGV